MLSISTSTNVLQAQAGEVLSWQKISATEGNFTEDLDEKDHFGTAVAAIGDFGWAEDWFGKNNKAITNISWHHWHAGYIFFKC